MAENRRSWLPVMIIVGGILLFLAGLVLVIGNRSSAQVATPTPATVAQVQRVSLEDAKAAFENRKATFLDVRDPSAYAASHIPGALNIPLSELPKRMNELNPKVWIIPY